MKSVAREAFKVSVIVATDAATDAAPIHPVAVGVGRFRDQ
jgi:hypothetical protein